ncbi:MAG: peptidylprolyl isomerase [Rhodoluna sp.]|jgi:peptidyl-prolyl cis-trans isomerase A (cyclophilin A)|uniref:peptidylprolyl isomerase n=1 Tax=freshwater metagenome TaxID=449393 RepID=A0A6J6BIS9_9ZZZZ|nr:peptidylprolyl isomerase [Actinomycetota bacterium]
MSIHTSVATMHTNHGDIKINLFGDHAPVTVANFEGLAEGTKEWTDPRTGEKRNDPLYNGVIFHRIIENFMIQGGDPLGMGYGGPGYNFKDEPHAELTFDEPYKLAMANAGPGTNGSQFFITVAPTTWLWGKHTVFGEVADEQSKKVVDKIGQVATGAQDRPIDDVVIESITIERV